MKKRMQILAVLVLVSLASALHDKPQAGLWSVRMTIDERVKAAIELPNQEMDFCCCVCNAIHHFKAMNELDCTMEICSTSFPDACVNVPFWAGELKRLKLIESSNNLQAPLVLSRTLIPHDRFLRNG